MYIFQYYARLKIINKCIIIFIIEWLSKASVSSTASKFSNIVENQDNYFAEEINHHSNIAFKKMTSFLRQKVL